MKLELNKRYVRRDGAITGPLVTTGSTYFTFKDPLTGHTYKPDGGYRVSDIENNADIVDEYPEQSEPLNLESRILNLLQDCDGAIPSGFCELKLELQQVFEILQSRIAQPASDVYDSDTLETAHRQMQTAVDATLAYPEAMQYLNDAGITQIIRDDDRYYVNRYYVNRYHVTTLNDGTYTINESGFLFKQIKL